MTALETYKRALKSLGDDVSFALDVIPDDEAIEVPAGGEEHTSLGRFREPVTEANIILGLRPTGEQEHIDHNAIPLAEEAFAECRGLGARIGWVEHVELRTLEMCCWESVGDQDDLTIGSVDGRQILTGELQRMLDVGEVRMDLIFADFIPTHIGS